MRRAATPFAALLLAAALYAGARPVGPLPALGPFLDPVHGVWGAAAGRERRGESRATLPGLGAAVRVVYDDRAVPHIFAATEADAYRALGYVVARDRLFQLDIQTRAASGRLSEIVGPRALELDREPRRLGMVRAAERKLAALDSASLGARAIAAYADGVNAYIDSLRPADYPLEYRLLGAAPERWRPIDSVHLLDRMGFTLAYGENELQRAAVAALVGGAAADALFPRHMPVQEPIQPNGSGGVPRFDPVVLPPPGQPDGAAGDLARLLETVRDESRGLRGADVASADALGGDALGGDALGSNNWAVAPSRTKGGHALLAGDPHLELSLPSIWYEAHLVVPGRLDVYGVTIPGAPGIVIGFNRDVAWTFTNSGADVVDFYAETVDDTLRPTRYLVDGAWRPVERRVERYLGPHGEALGADTVYYTHRGPMRNERGAHGLRGRWISMRWTVLDPSNETDALLRASRARDAGEWFRAMGAWESPAQNMLVADRAGSIAIRAVGKLPERPGDGGGDRVRDGATSASDWLGFRPASREPGAVRPAQGFLASANQEPVDPRVDPSYLGTEWPDPWRAIRINALLRGDSAVTPEAMRRWQTDPGSARADVFVPAFLVAAERVLHAGTGDSRLRAAARLLGEWDRRYTRDNERAVLFEAAMRQLADRTWDELVPAGAAGAAGAATGRRVATPSGAVLASLLRDPGSAWWDDRRTPEVREDADAILAASLRAALDETERTHGRPADGGWRWDRVHHVNIYHLLRIPGLSRLDLPVQGGPSTLSPSSGRGTHGASWRMVVELGPEPRAWGIYPGGQSGDPASQRYADRLPKWLAGELDTLRVPRDAAALDAAHTSAVLTLAPAAGAPAGAR